MQISTVTRATSNSRSPLLLMAGQMFPLAHASCTPQASEAKSMYLPHRYSLWFLTLTLSTWCAIGSSASAQGAPGHGADAKGTPLGPNLTDTQWLWGDGSFASIAKTITSGVPEPKKYRSPMPPMGGAQLSSDQVSALAAYIWALSHRTHE